MADIIDEANDLNDLNIQHALLNRQLPPVFSGKCKYCGEEIHIGSFCDSNCKVDYEKHERALLFKHH